MCKLPKFAALSKDLKGTALIEFAVIAPVMCIMLIGLVDISMFISARLSVQRAARAGGEYAVLNTYDATNISTAITSATGTRSSYMTATQALPEPAKWCGCPDATTGLTAQACGTKCTATGLDAGTYVTASARATFTPLFPWPGYSSSNVIDASSTVRIE